MPSRQFRRRFRFPVAEALVSLLFCLAVGYFVGQRVGRKGCPTDTHSQRRVASGAPGCSPYGDIVQQAVERSPAPQLNQAQLLWIASLLNSQSWNLARALNFLVFGLGHDSNVWHSINCQGRTVFVENSDEWLHKITSAYPQLEVSAA
jgi:hypothetical protein